MLRSMVKVGCCVAVALWLNIAAAAPLEDALSGRLQALTVPTELKPAGRSLHAGGDTIRFYQQRAFRPAWFAASGAPTAEAQALPAALLDLAGDGLNPADYHLEAIQRLLGNAGSVEHQVDAELLLTDAYLTAARHVHAGRLTPARVDADWGIQPRQLDGVATLEDAMTAGQAVGRLRELAPKHPEYAYLREALRRYRALQQHGGWPTVAAGPTLRPGESSARVRSLRARLKVTGDLAEQAAASKSEVYDAVLADAVRHFQKRHGLEADGNIGESTIEAMNVPVAQRIRQIEVNLERWRWLPERFGDRYILVNIPSFELKVIDEGREVLDSRVVVGKTVRPTPVLSSTLSHIVLSPSWYVPQKIAVEDMLPQLRNDPGVLSRQRIRIYDRRSGQELDPSTVDWSSYGRGHFPFRMRQEPGAGNALGRVKFIFPNEHNVYLHDTSKPQLFNRSQRTYSSGCIRVSKPIELAEYLLRGDERWTREAIVAAGEKGQEKTVFLPREVLVHLMYWTASADAQGQVQFLNDIYRRDPKIAQALPTHTL